MDDHHLCLVLFERSYFFVRSQVFGICPECKGEGFVLKRLSDGSAEKARLNAKNMATRHCRVRTNFFYAHKKRVFFFFLWP
ncbi:hypothetical protein Hanom_Chr15g01368051 [Helianthus anomalus]